MAPPSPTLPPAPTPEAVTSADDVRRISPAEARVLVEGGGALLYDTRSAASYGSRHAAGAISFPESEAAGRVGELPADKGLIFY
jgi:rhodanese-related sulfurtransferase